jgi:hypothetical protein
MKLIVNPCPIKQWPYQMNPNHVQRIKEDLDKLLDTIYLSHWKYSMVIIGCNCTEEKQHITHLCGLSKIEFTNQKISISITFFGFSIKIVVGHGMYFFMDGCSDYN